MKTLVLASLMALLVPLAPPQNASPVQTGTWTARLEDTWTRNNGERWVSFQLQEDTDRRFGMSVPLSDLNGLGAPGERWTSPGVIRFTMTRDAGDVSFEGTFSNGRGWGTYRFAAHPDYVAAMGRAGYRDLDTDMLFRLTLHDVSRAFVASIQAEGYRSASLEDLLRMRIHGIDADYIKGLRQAGYDCVSIEDLVRTRIHGATPSYLAELRAAGYSGLNVEDLIRTRIQS